MGWIETFFGLSPDGGSGATEAATVLGLALVVAVAIAVRRRNARRWRAR
jgi:hypothetical protein